MLNFMSAEFFEKCMATIKNNEPEADEISASGLTPRPASWVDAPMVDECFMNLECRYQWEKEIVPGDDHAMICLEVIGMHIDETHLAGRTGDQSVLFNIHHPQNPEITEKTGHDYAGVIQKKSMWENIDCGPYSNPKGGASSAPNSAASMVAAPLHGETAIYLFQTGANCLRAFDDRLTGCGG